MQLLYEAMICLSAPMGGGFWAAVITLDASRRRVAGCRNLSDASIKFARPIGDVFDQHRRRLERLQYLFFVSFECGLHRRMGLMHCVSVVFPESQCVHRRGARQLKRCINAVRALLTRSLSPIRPGNR